MRNPERDEAIKMDRFEGGMSLQEIAAKYKLSMGRISQICSAGKPEQLELPLVSHEEARVTDRSEV